MFSEDLDKYQVKNTFKENIEPEEIFLDAEKIKQETNEGRMEVPVSPKIFILFFSFIILSFLILLARAGQLQIIKGKEFLNLSERNRTRIFVQPALRGIIYDKFQNPLVYNVPSFDLVVSPLDLPKERKKLEALIIKLAQILDEPVENIKEQIEQALKDKSSQKFSIFLNIDREKLLSLESEINNLEGVSIEKNSVRQYVYPFYFSHILGFLGKLTPEDLKNHSDYYLIEKIGREGLERQYETILRGQPGIKEIEVNSLGEEKGILNIKEPVAGNGLVLSIDSGLQIFLYNSLKKWSASVKSEASAAVALNPNNGQILALVSLPSFDNNLFAQTISEEDFKNLSTNPNQPLFNRVIAGQYPPGSTIKPFIGAAALEEGIISRSTKINCPGELTILNQYNPNIVYHFRDWKAHGLTDIIKAIAQSCDVAFYYYGGGFGDFEGLGIERIKKYLKLFNFGETTNIDLPGEKSGFIPDKEWKEAVKNEKWHIGDTYHVSIGQGDILVTPLQLAVATAAIANNGILYQPQILDKIIDADKNIIKEIKPQIINQNFISLKNIDIIKRGMREAVVNGTARFLADLPVRVAGKTGTAQFGNQGKTHAWFSAFAPYEEPEIVLVILIEGGGEGSAVAVPVAKEVLNYYFSKKPKSKQIKNLNLNN